MRTCLFLLLLLPSLVWSWQGAGAQTLQIRGVKGRPVYLVQAGDLIEIETRTEAAAGFLGVPMRLKRTLGDCRDSYNKVMSDSAIAEGDATWHFTQETATFISRRSRKKPIQRVYAKARPSKLWMMTQTITKLTQDSIWLVNCGLRDSMAIRDIHRVYFHKDFRQAVPRNRPKDKAPKKPKPYFKTLGHILAWTIGPLLIPVALPYVLIDDRNRDRWYVVERSS